MAFNQKDADALDWDNPEWCDGCKRYYPLPDGWPFDACPVCEWLTAVEAAANKPANWGFAEISMIAAANQIAGVAF